MYFKVDNNDQPNNSNILISENDRKSKPSDYTTLTVFALLLFVLRQCFIPG